VLHTLDAILDSNNISKFRCSSIRDFHVSLRGLWQRDVVELWIVHEHIAEQDIPAEINPAHEAAAECNNLV
jgi:hypothetical protein